MSAIWTYLTEKVFVAPNWPHVSTAAALGAYLGWKLF